MAPEVLPGPSTSKPDTDSVGSSSCSLQGHRPRAEEGHWALAGDFLWDGSSEEASPRQCVIVRGQRIVRVCSVQEAVDLDLPVEHYPGCTVMPGLIDAHVHMEFSEHFPLHQQPEFTAMQLREAMAERALRMLRSGITTARDLGGRNYAAIGLRNAIRRGECLGPRLLCAGQPLTRPGGHCHQWGGEAGSLDEALAVVDRQVENGVDWIKVMATGGMRTPGTNVEEATISVRDLTEVVGRARENSLAVAAHAHGAQGVVHAVQAGCRTVEHCSWIAKAGQWGCVDDSTVEAMARQGTAVAPTAHANWRYKPMGERNYTRMCAALQKLRAAGVLLLASSDAGAIPGLPHDALHGGIEVLAEMARMTPVEALKAATSVPAAVLGLEAECGRLAPDLSADILVVAGIPTEDLGALGRPVLVVAGGRRVQPLAPPPPWPKVARPSRPRARQTGALNARGPRRMA
ncbi:unnamed protein product [Symbiodinium natans]|uniref:Amidohydrolase-related domain-containing protein n=1 Tax=Symbiodinium natans TaxID=878477 RepID=A0A812HPC5_9DINO|nr:unnamed protein product [Symbiodinium natans]